MTELEECERHVWMNSLRRLKAQLMMAGARVPMPEQIGTIESAMVSGLSIALLLVEGEIVLAEERSGG